MSWGVKRITIINQAGVKRGGEQVCNLPFQAIPPSLFCYFLHSSQTCSSVSFWGIQVANNECRDGKEIGDNMWICTKAGEGKKIKEEEPLPEEKPK